MKINQVEKPAFCCIAPTDYCMLQCKMCNKWNEPAPKAEELPSIADWKRFITQFRDLVDEDFELDFGGGEVLSMPGILEMVEHATKLGFRTTVASNGWLIDQDMAKRIGDSGLKAVSLSLDSPLASVHDEMRGVKGVYDRVMQSLENLSKYAPKTRKGFCSIIMNRNLDHVVDLVHLANGHPLVDWIYFMVVVQPNYSGALTDAWLDEYQYLWPENKEKVNQVIDELIRLKLTDKTKISNRAEHLRAYKAYLNDPLTFVNKAQCIVGGKALSVNTYGFIQLCLFKDFIGNIRDNDIRELWKSQNAEALRAKVKTCKQNCHLLLNCCFIEDDASLYKGNS
jgi:MoaA/NifB/PqqE/SkfB family radical SAM enzyme